MNQTQTKNDFIAESKGACFICSKEIQPPLQTKGSISTTSSTATVYSLHCLSRYLKMDMKKVFRGEGPLPAHLVARVEKSRLSAELCEECAVLTGKFSNLFRQLEKIGMEMSSCLDLINVKLEGAVKAGNKKNISGDIKSYIEWETKLEIVEALRKEASEKCSRKLGAVLPQAKLQNLSGKKVDTEKLKTKSNYVGGEDAKSPISDLMPAEDGNDFDIGDEPHCPINDLETVKKELLEVTEDADYVQANKWQISTQHNDENDGVRNKKWNDLSKNIPPPIKVAGGVGKPQSIINPETGKHKCLICSKEYVDFTGLNRHHSSAHLKVRHKCRQCKKDFPHKQVYERHYLSIHVGVRFECGECNKTFSQKENLVSHQQSAHLGKRFQCKYCPRTFPHMTTRSHHMKINCPGRKALSADVD